MSDFHKFATAVHARYEQMAKGELYVVGTRDGNGNLNNRQLEVALEVAKHIIGVKEAENAAKQDAQARESKRAQLEELKAKKQGEAMEGLTLEEIQKQLDDLKA